ncbi:hypothetical protein TGARI_368100 [Toxoplasma gondii ARI]|uniref:Transmembrane protein n=1 Tax=Toxoplasma gondii ARI TaxID=1074872 RepID=A0A139YA57_TOXGO|nr:hypothetical protein TGARI_368100 [Toxoplasma gondii ARI]
MGKQRTKPRILRMELVIYHVKKLGAAVHRSVRSLRKATPSKTPKRKLPRTRGKLERHTFSLSLFILLLFIMTSRNKSSNFRSRCANLHRCHARKTARLQKASKCPFLAPTVLCPDSPRISKPKYLNALACDSENEC